MIISKTFYFESAHFLPGHPHCGQMHGHSYKLEVKVDGKINPENGMVMDFKTLSELINTKVIKKLDHNMLNNILEIPTAEHIIIWIMNQLPVTLKFGLKLWETKDSYAEISI